MWELSDQAWALMSTTLTELCAETDLLVAGQSYQEPAANVAEYYSLPFATLHNTPARPNGRLLSALPAPVGRSAMEAFDWFTWLLNKKVEDAQRRDLNLHRAKKPISRRVAARHALEIQAYDSACFPGLAAEWADWGTQRPFVGALTMGGAEPDDSVAASWIASGAPPICFGFGSMPVRSPRDTVTMIAAACAALGERALICSGWSDYRDVPTFDHVTVVGTVNYATVFPACRAVVHHGGAGTTAASMRAGVPTLVLWMDGAQPIWASRVKALRVGTARSFATSTEATLIADLHQILSPDYATAARRLARQMTDPTESVDQTADLLEQFCEESRRP